VVIVSLTPCNDCERKYKSQKQKIDHGGNGLLAIALLIKLIMMVHSTRSTGFVYPHWLFFFFFFFFFFFLSFFLSSFFFLLSSFFWLIRKKNIRVYFIIFNKKKITTSFFSSDFIKKKEKKVSCQYRKT
jgi:hypothetical protein